MENDTVTLRVSVCYPTSTEVWQRDLTVPAGSTVGQVLLDSGFQAAFPHVDAWLQGVGIFGKVCQPSTQLVNGDRVEVYRSLTFDPMVSRRRRADHRRAKATVARKGRVRPAGLL